MAAPNDLLKKVLALSPAEKAALVDELLSSLEKPDEKMDTLWAREAEDRTSAAS